MSLNKTGDTPFLCAVRYFRGYETLQKYIDAGIDINWRDKNGKPLIHLAASFGTFGALKFLHENGADILLVGDTGETALHLAAAVADYNYTALEYLIEKGADLEADCERFGTPLMAAARNNARTTNLLLQKGAKVNAISESCASHNALQTAASEGTYDIVNALIKADADANIRGGSYGSALCASVARDYNDSKIVKLLLENEKDINYAEGPRGSALELAISRQSLEIAELFFNRDVDVNIISKGKYGTALIAAIEVGEINAVEKLLDLKADVNLFQACGESPVQIAIRKGRQNIVELLVKNGAKLDYRDNHGRGVLSHAISQQSFDLLPYLLQQEDIDINQQDDLGRTPLIHATIQGHIIMNDIIAQKPKMDLQDRWGKTALAHAVSRDYGPLVSSLIAAEADPLVRDIRGRDALYWAALQASQNTFEQVLKKLEALNASSSSFQHAVIAATNANNYEFVQQLLKDRLFPDYHKDQDGWTAPYNARFYDRWRIDLLIYRAFRGIYRGEEDSKPPVAPTQWHPTDMSRYLARQPDNISIKLDPEALLPGIEDAAMVRADHAMVPNEDGIYYFEITVVNGGDAVRASVGFCDEKANLDDMLGCQEGTWGYHGDDGNVFAGNSDGNPYGPKYGEGSVVGCGVNFGEGTAFYTHNGEVIGRASTNVQGKLYPAVSIDTRAVDCTLTARFWSDDESERKLFKFQGPYDDSKTLESSQRYKDEGGAKQGKDSDDSSFDSSDFDSD
ncbi:ankyrin repeat-containing domain protein [Xylaria intraflava]|nr:ankyrin repeat-containing domain protein [Xylaria intraflava]